MKLYCDFATQEEINARYDVLGSVPDAGARIQGWADQSVATVARLKCPLDVRCGPIRAEHRDLFPAGPRSTATNRMSGSGPCRWAKR